MNRTSNRKVLDSIPIPAVEYPKKDTSSSPWLIHRKRWLRADMAEKLFKNVDLCIQTIIKPILLFVTKIYSHIIYLLPCFRHNSTMTNSLRCFSFVPVSRNQPSCDETYGEGLSHNHERRIGANMIQLYVAIFL